MTKHFNSRLASWISLILVGIAIAFAFDSKLSLAVLCLGIASVIQTLSRVGDQKFSQLRQQISQVEQRLAETALPAVTPSAQPVERGRVMIFVDADNLYFSGINNNQSVVYETLVDHLFVGAATKVDAIFYFNNMTRLDNVIATMESAGFKIVRPGPRPEDSTARPTDLDPEIIRDLDAYKNDYDTGVLVSGDKHFVNSVKQLIRQGKRVEVVGFESATNRGLKRFCTQYIDVMSLEGVCSPRLVKKGETKDNQS